MRLVVRTHTWYMLGTSTLPHHNIRCTARCLTPKPANDSSPADNVRRSLRSKQTRSSDWHAGAVRWTRAIQRLRLREQIKIKFRTDKAKQTEHLALATHVNGWVSAVHMSYTSQTVLLLRLSKLSALKFSFICSCKRDQRRYVAVWQLMVSSSCVTT